MDFSSLLHTLFVFLAHIKIDYKNNENYFILTPAANWGFVIIFLIRY